MLALVGGTLIDGSGRDPIPDSIVVVGDDQRIVAAGSRAAVQVPEDCPQIDITGKTLLPGLIDCHDHLASFTYDLASRWGLSEPNSTRTVRIARVMEETLRTGYTTVRDCGWLDAGFRVAVEQGLVDGPRLLVAAGPLSPTHGVQDRPSPSGHRRTTPPDPNIPYGIADGVDGIRAAIRENVRAGADVTKVFQTGFGNAIHTDSTTAYSLAELRALVEESHAQGKKVACHAIGGPGLRTAVEAGVDSIEHGCYLDLEPDLLKMMSDQDTYLVPTITVFSFHEVRGNPVAQAESAAFKHHHVETVQKALAAGVKVVAGTDAGGWEHGNNSKELEWLVAAGMTPMQSLMAGTSWAAGCLGLGSDLGTIESGKIADLVVVDGNPLADITILQDNQRIQLVMKEGKVYHDSLTGRP